MECEEGRLVDLAVWSHQMGQGGIEATCRAHGAREACRRDFIITTPDVARWCIHLKVDTAAGYDVHAPLHAQLKVPREETFDRLFVPKAFERPEGVTTECWRQDILQSYQ
eukprot:4279992-Alexandrium_andersonii.AAC.1